MPRRLQFEHIRIPSSHTGKARFPRGGGRSARSIDNESNATSHANDILGKGRQLNDYWRQVREDRSDLQAPELPPEVPMLIQVDPGFNLDSVRSSFDFEVVAEFDNGFLVIANDDLDFTSLESTMNKLINGERGGGSAARIYDLITDDTQDSRLQMILSQDLYGSWGNIIDNNEYIVDVGVECLGKIKPPKEPERKPRDTDATYATKINRYQQKLLDVYQQWDDLKYEREVLLSDFVNQYNGEVGSIVDGDVRFGSGVFSLTDSFTARVKISGNGLRDLALNFPFIFEISSPDEIETYTGQIIGPHGEVNITIEGPEEDSPSVCVIDSGIQENHPLLVNALNPEHSICLIPGHETATADFVNPNGHGTRVAGAILFRHQIPRTGVYTSRCFVQNARVLDANNKLPMSLFPPDVISKIVEKYSSEEMGKTKIFNHSIAGNRPCNVKQMSAWAASIDLVSFQNDIVFIQAVGNIPASSNDPIQPGVLQHLRAGRTYPDYLLNSSSRIANPAQSLSALTVGSVANNVAQNGLQSFTNNTPGPSAFSRTGLGIWGDIKPEVVEYGGDYAHDGNNPPSIVTPEMVCVELVRAQNGIGPHFSKDNVGTSFSTPMVSSIAVELQKLFPNEPALLYKALIIQSARWPRWAFEDRNTVNLNKYIRYFGYGIPDLTRAIEDNANRITLYTAGLTPIKVGDVHIFQVPIPESISTQANLNRVLIETTLTYVAEPRRTRRKPRGYLGVWLDWVTSKANQSKEAFHADVAKEFNEVNDNSSAIPWALGTRVDTGDIEGTRRNLGTSQKDWAILEAHQLPRSFCIAVRGHQGWDYRPEACAKYSLVVSFEAIDGDLEIYNPIKVEVDNLEVPIDIEVDL